jgi:hypothetical protein
MRHLCVWLALLVGLGLTLSAVPTRAADKADSETIDKLVKQLGSGRFSQREQAQKKLEEIGQPAVEALKKAVDTGDMETKRRANEIIAKLDKQVQGAKILAPTKIRLSYKDTPLAEALADITKKTGYNLTLVDPQNKLKDRKVTVDTGETTFWQALEKFCSAAKLVEADLQDLNQAQPVPQPFPQPQPLPPIKILPGGIQKLPGVLPVVPPANAPQQLPAKVLQVQIGQAQAGQAQAGKGKVVPAQPPVAAQPVQGFARPAIRRPFPIQPQVPSNQILLKDGTPKGEPTDYAGAVRVKVMDNVQMFGGPGKDEAIIGLKVSPEPKIRWQQLVNVRIDKAIDDQDQKLMPVMKPEDGGQPNPFGAFGGGFPGGGFRPIGNGWGFQGFQPGFGGLHQHIPVRLTKGEKPAKQLKELSGVITAQVLTEAEVYLEAAEIMKAAGKTFKGNKQGGSLKINAINENNGQIVIQLEMENPRDVVPAGGQNPGFGVGGPVWNGPGIQILPVLPVNPPPAPLPAPAPKLKGALQAPAQGRVQVQAAQVPVQVQVQGQGKVQVQVQQIQIGGGGIAIAPFNPGFNPGGHTGLELLDEKGKVIPMVGYGSAFRGGPGGGVFTPEHHLTFQPQEGQKPAKLVFKGSKSVNVEIPFTLKNVKLP